MIGTIIPHRNRVGSRFSLLAFVAIQNSVQMYSTGDFDGGLDLKGIDTIEFDYYLCFGLWKKP